MAAPRVRVPWHRRVLLDPAAVRYWTVVAVAAIVLGAGVHRTLARAEATHQAWGRTQPVWVTTAPVRAGALLEGAVALRQWPAHLVPEAALTEVPASARAVAALDAGTPVTAVAIDGGRDGVADERVVAVPRGEATPPIAPDDRVEIWATVDPAFPVDGGPATRRVATAARVVSVQERTVAVAIDPDEVAALTHAVSSATISLVWLR